MEKLIYIYNPRQASFYIGSGCKYVESSINPRTNKRFWAFIRNETNSAYKEWCKSNKGLRE